MSIGTVKNTKPQTIFLLQLHCEVPLEMCLPVEACYQRCPPYENGSKRKMICVKKSKLSPKKRRQVTGEASSHHFSLNPWGQSLRRLDDAESLTVFADGLKEYIDTFVSFQG